MVTLTLFYMKVCRRRTFIPVQKTQSDISGSTIRTGYLNRAYLDEYLNGDCPCLNADPCGFAMTAVSEYQTRQRSLRSSRGSYAPSWSAGKPRTGQRQADFPHCRQYERSTECKTQTYYSQYLAEWPKSQMLGLASCFKSCTTPDSG